MKARIIIGAQHAYACLSDDNFTMDVQLDHGHSASASLRHSASEMRTKANDMLRRAERMEAGAALLENWSPS